MTRLQRQWAVLAGMTAYASHAVLDASTTYGTQLLWPFSRHRVGLDIISIVDPLFTLIVLVGMIAALVMGGRGIAVSALTLAAIWLGAGFVQRERATAAQVRLAAARGDRLERGEVFPTIGNTLVWRSIYETDGVLRIDRIRVPWFGEATYATVAEAPLATAEAARGDARMRRDFERFSWFSNGWVARSPTDRNLIGDARYSLRSDRYEPVWGIRFRPGAEPPTEWVNRARQRNAGVAEVWKEITGRDPGFRRLNR